MAKRQTSGRKQKQAEETVLKRAKFMLEGSGVVSEEAAVVIAKPTVVDMLVNPKAFMGELEEAICEMVVSTGIA